MPSRLAGVRRYRCSTGSGRAARVRAQPAGRPGVAAHEAEGSGRRRTAGPSRPVPAHGARRPLEGGGAAVVERPILDPRLSSSRIGRRDDCSL